MGQALWKLFDSVFGKAEMQVVMLGLDAAGKTTILYKLQIGEVLMGCWGPREGEAALETLLQQYRWAVYVVDSLDRERIGKAKEEFQTIINDPFMLNSAILVFANKQDMKGAMTPHWLASALKETKNIGLSSFLSSSLF